MGDCAPAQWVPLKGAALKCYLGAVETVSPRPRARRRVAAESAETRDLRGVFATSRFRFAADVQLARLLQMCADGYGNAVSSADGSILERGKESSRGKKAQWRGRSKCRFAPPSALSIARSPFAQEVGLDPDRSPKGLRGSCPVLPLSRLARERGERNSSQPICSLVSVFTVRHKKTKYARSTKPGEQWGSSRSLLVLSGRGSQKAREHPSLLGCLFDCGRGPGRRARSRSEASRAPRVLDTSRGQI
jgi:hypothetical protein